jgi:hypothetical protein
MKHIKLFEGSNDETVFIFSDVVNYYDANEQLIYNFILKIINLNMMVKFNCRVCKYDLNRTVHYIHYNKIHKGIIKGFEYELSDHINLDLAINNIKFYHEVNTNLPFTIYGKLPDDIKKTIDEINMIRNIKKYNL